MKLRRVLPWVLLLLGAVLGAFAGGYAGVVITGANHPTSGGAPHESFLMVLDLPEYLLGATIGAIVLGITGGIGGWFGGRYLERRLEPRT